MTYEILNNLHCWMLMSVKLTLAVPSRDKPIYQQCLKKLKTIKHKELTILIIASYEGRNYDELLTFISSDFLTINVGFLTYFHSHVIDEQFPISSVSYSNTPTILLRLDNFPPSDGYLEVYSASETNFFWTREPANSLTCPRYHSLTVFSRYYTLSFTM